MIERYWKDASIFNVSDHTAQLTSSCRLQLARFNLWNKFGSVDEIIAIKALPSNRATLYDTKNANKNFKF